MVPKCPELAAEQLERFGNEGVTLTPDETAELLYWAGRVNSPSGAVGYLSEDAPVAVGGRILWPLTLQAHEWLRWAAEHLAGDMATAATGYAAEHGRDEGAFDSLYTTRAALAAVSAWRRGFAATMAQLRHALDMLGDPPRRIGQDPDEDETGTPDLSAVVADVVAATGLPAEYFMRHSGRHFLRVARTSAVLTSIRAGQKSHIARPEDDALMQFTLLVRDIRSRHRAQGDTGNCGP